MKKNILYGIEATTGGALKHVLYLSTRLSRDRFTFTIALSARRNASIATDIQRLEQQGIRVVVIDMRRSINLRADLLSFIEICRLVRSNRYDVIHAHSSKAGVLFRLAGWLYGVPVIIYTPHCFFFQGQRGLKRKLFITCERLLSKLTHHIVVSDNEMKEALAAGVCAPGKIRNINNAIDLDEYGSPAAVELLKAKYGVPERTVVIGGIGRLEKQKNFDLLIEVAGEICVRYDHVCFVVAGEGSYFDRLRMFIEKAGLRDRVILTGYVENISEIYAIIDIYLSTSLREGLPYVLLEAAYFKKPIVASLKTDFGEPVCVQATSRPGCAPIVERISALIENKKLMIETGIRNRDITAHKHSFAAFIQRHEALYMA